MPIITPENAGLLVIPMSEFRLTGNVHLFGDPPAGLYGLEGHDEFADDAAYRVGREQTIPFTSVKQFEPVGFQGNRILVFAGLLEDPNREVINGIQVQIFPLHEAHTIGQSGRIQNPTSQALRNIHRFIEI